MLQFRLVGFVRINMASWNVVRLGLALVIGLQKNFLIESQ